MWGYLVSRLNHPVTIIYGKEKFVMGAQGKSGSIQKELIKYLPHGIMFVQEDTI
jgi:hypothetical protein